MPDREKLREQIVELIKVAFEPDETVEKAYQVWKGEHYKYADFWSETKINNRSDALADAILSLLQPDPQTEAVQDVLAERQRQIEKEGWSHWHDDQHHDDFELARAAGCYALNVANCAQIEERKERYLANNPATMFVKAPRFWPWLSKWWKPKNPRRDLVRAAALIIAEIERLDRAEESK